MPKAHVGTVRKGKNMPGGKEIKVHWDEMVESQNDGLMRPTISIEGVLKCDYYDYEISGAGGGQSKACQYVVVSRVA